jgi:hypothetical protein
MRVHIGLEVTRDTIRGWRVFRLAQSCRLTTLASFELALLRDDDEETIVCWPCDPYQVLAPLLRGEAPAELAHVPHRTVVSRAMPGRFRVTTEES